MMDNKIKPITLEIEKDLWYAYKKIVPRTVKLNTAVCNLIQAAVLDARREPDNVVQSTQHDF